VRLVPWLPERWHALTREIAKFGTIGVINLFVNLAVWNLLMLTVLRGGEVKAKVVATIVATTCAYFMNRHWTYRDRPKSTLHREYTLFFFFNLVGLVIEAGVIYAAKYGLDTTHILVLNLANGLGIGLGTIFRFWAYRTHVFKPHTAEELAAAEAAAPAAPVRAAPAGMRQPAVVHPPAVVPAPTVSVESELASVELEEELNTLVSGEQQTTPSRS
jgi:putative flippase GtrA